VGACGDVVIAAPAGRAQQRRNNIMCCVNLLYVSLCPEDFQKIPLERY